MRTSFGLLIAASVLGSSPAAARNVPGAMVAPRAGTPGTVLLLQEGVGAASDKAEGAGGKILAERAAADLVKAKRGGILQQVKYYLHQLNVGSSEPDFDTAASALAGCKVQPAQEFRPAGLAPKHYYLVPAACPAPVYGADTIYLAVGEEGGKVISVYLNAGLIPVWIPN